MMGRCERNMMKSECKDKLRDMGLLWLRMIAGAGIAYHGYGKVFGEWMPKFIEGVGEMGFPMPMVFAWAAALSEFVGGILLAAGLGTRFAAAAIFGTMAVAAFVAHAADPLQKKELALAYWTIAGALMMTGGGRFSLDSKLCCRCEPSSCDASPKA